MNNKHVIACSQLLAQQRLKIAFAESATSGCLAYHFTNTPHSGQTLLGSIVCYDLRIKEKILNVPPQLIEKYSAESLQVTEEIATRAHHLFNADVTIGVTGLTKPGGSENEAKPVGTMFFCILYRDRPHLFRHYFKGSPANIVESSISYIAAALMDLLHSSH